MTTKPIRIALKLEYNGAAYSGWQKQKSPAIPTIQGFLEKALSQVADTPIETVCAGRTDAGVHASCQIVHFDSPIDRGSKAWEQGVNSLLPDTIRVKKSVSVDPDFHARFSAIYRRYNYVIHIGQFKSAFIGNLSTHQRRTLDVALMNEAAQYLLGEQDFSSFRAAGCQSKTANRNVISAAFYKSGDLLVFDIKANAFLQHMVRNIMGTLLVIGAKEKEASWLAELLAAKDRTKAAMTAPPNGLYLTEVGYDANQSELGEYEKPPILAGS